MVRVVEASTGECQHRASVLLRGFPEHQRKHYVAHLATVECYFVPIEYEHEVQHLSAKSRVHGNSLMKKNVERCPWCLKDDIYMHYHDTVWGVPEHDDRNLFAKLCLDGAQAGLSWYTILIRTEGYARAFDNWDAEKIARYTPKKIEKLLLDPGIIRNRQKVESVVKNAKAYLRIMEGGKGSFDDFLWKHTGHRTMVNQWKELKQLPASTPISDAMSKDLKKAWTDGRCPLREKHNAIGWPSKATGVYPIIFWD